MDWWPLGTGHPWPHILGFDSTLLQFFRCSFLDALSPTMWAYSGCFSFLAFSIVLVPCLDSFLREHIRRELGCAGRDVEPGACMVMSRLASKDGPEDLH